MTTFPPGTGPLSPDFAGIDPGLMDGFITEMDHARGVIGERTEAIRRVFAANGVPATSLDPIGEVERWIDQHLPDLRRRNQIARNTAKLPDWSPGTASTLLPYEEKSVLPAAEAQRLGTELATQYKKINPDALFDPGLDEKYQKIVDTLTAHVHDPDFTAAFFAGLGLKSTLELPERLRRGLQEGEKSAVDAVSLAFGTAVSAGATAAGFAAISKAMKNKAENYDEQNAIGDLLSAGRFPTEWLAQVVATQVFTPGDKSVGSTLTPYLNALAKDSGAARLAITLATRDSPHPKDVLARFSLPGLRSSDQEDRRPDLVTFLKNLNDRAAVDATSADGFGRLLASASGAYDEKDGKHTDIAARFAFTVMTTADEFKTAEPTRIHLSEIAGAYATEMTEGANLGDANHLLPSTFGNLTSPMIAGLRSMFRLSPQDTYQFIKTFANTDANLKPFDTGMGKLARRLIDGGVADMAKSQNPAGLDDVFAALGNVRGFELATAEKLRTAADDMNEEDRKAFSWLVGNAMGAVGLVFPGGVPGAALWTAVSTGWSTHDTYKPDPDKQADMLKEHDNLETLGRQHAIAQSLMDSGFAPKISPRDYQATRPPGITIAGSDGKLRPFAEIMKYGDEGIQALDRWFIENGAGGTDDLVFGKISERLADRFNGQKSVAWPRARLYERSD